MRPSLTAANCDGSPNRPSLRRESAFRDCASITPASLPGNSFTTAELHPHVVKALGCAPESYTLASLRYDLSKLRAKGLVTKLPNSRRYQLLPQGYSVCLVFLKLFERVCARLRRVSSAPSAPTPESLIKSGLNSTASITASSMTLMHSSRLSASKPQRNNGAAREQNPHHSHYNGLKGRPAGRPLRSRFSVLLPCPAHRRDFPLIYGHISPCA